MDNYDKRLCVQEEIKGVILSWEDPQRSDFYNIEITIALDASGWMELWPLTNFLCPRRFYTPPNPPPPEVPYS